MELLVSHLPLGAIPAPPSHSPHSVIGRGQCRWRALVSAECFTRCSRPAGLLARAPDGRCAPRPGRGNRDHGCRARSYLGNRAPPRGPVAAALPDRAGPVDPAGGLEAAPGHPGFCRGDGHPPHPRQAHGPALSRWQDLPHLDRASRGAGRSASVRLHLRSRSHRGTDRRRRSDRWAFRLRAGVR